MAWGTSRNASPASVNPEVSHRDYPVRNSLDKTRIEALATPNYRSVTERKTIRRLAEALGVEPWDVLEFRRALSGDAPAEDE